MLGLSGEIGTLRPGVDADVTVLVQQPGRYILRDNEKTEVIADSLLQPAFCLRAGVRHAATAPILPRAVAA
jgi:dihydroorotase